MKPQSPCQKCEARYVGCHSECDNYSSFRKNVDEYNKLKRIDMARYTRTEFMNKMEIWSIKKK